MSHTVTTSFVACLPLDDSGLPVSSECPAMETLLSLDARPAVVESTVCDCEFYRESLRG